MNHLAPIFAHNRYGLYDLDDDPEGKEIFVKCLTNKLAFDTDWVSPDKLFTGFRIVRHRKNGGITITTTREMDDWDNGDIISDAAADIGREAELNAWYNKNRINIDNINGSWQMSEAYEKWEKSIMDICWELQSGNTETKCERTLPASATFEDIRNAIDEMDEETDEELKYNFETIKQAVGEALDQVKNNK